MDSIFPARKRVRSVQPSLASSVVFTEVKSLDQLLAALQPLDVSSTAALVANTGRRIVISAPIQLDRTVIIDESLPGTVIESNGYLPISCDLDGINAFDIRAPLCTLRGLLIASNAIAGGASTKRFLAAVKLSTSNADDCRVQDIHAFDVASLVVGVDGANRCRVRDCAIAVSSGVVGDGVAFSGTGWSIAGNTLSGSGGGLAVRGGASSERSTIVGNECGNAGINTAAGLGLNTIAANARAGLVVGAGTDQVNGNNT